jgi:hypothetical protein
MPRETKSELLLDDIEALMKAICGATGINRTGASFAAVAKLNTARK